MKRFVDIFEKITSFFSTVSAVFVIVIVFLIVISVLNRYVINLPINWPSEISQYLQCSVVMLVAASCLRLQIHTRVDLIYGSFSNRTRRWIEVIGGFFAFLISIPMAYFGAVLGWHSFMIGETSSSADRLPLWPSIASVFMGALVLGLQGMINVIKYGFMGIPLPSESTHNTQHQEGKRS